VHYSFHLLDLGGRTTSRANGCISLSKAFWILSTPRLAHCERALAITGCNIGQYSSPLLRIFLSNIHHQRYLLVGRVAEVGNWVYKSRHYHPSKREVQSVCWDNSAGANFWRGINRSTSNEARFFVWRSHCVLSKTDVAGKEKGERVKRAEHDAENAFQPEVKKTSSRIRFDDCTICR
jgi:hypothetical protein